MANGGYTGQSPIRDDSPEAYSGVWESHEQFAEVTAGRWAQQTAGLAPRSVRLNSADSAFFSRTPVVAGNRRTWTFSCWIKNAFTPSANPRIFSAGSSSSNTTEITLLATAEANELRVLGDVGGVRKMNWTTANKFRDPSAWFHLVVALDTPQALASNRLKIYINGVQITTAGAANTLPSQNDEFEVNNNSIHYIGRSGPYTEYMNGYLAATHLVDGQALEPEAFGFFDGAGVWQPRPYRGTYGQNGFFLDFSDNSAATATALGADRSGNGNNFTPNNLSVGSNGGPGGTITSVRVRDGAGNDAGFSTIRVDGVVLVQGAGTPDYRSFVSATGSYIYGTSVANTFTSNLGEAYVGGGASITFAPSPGIAYSQSVEIWTGGDGNNVVSFNNGSEISAPAYSWTLIAGSLPTQTDSLLDSPVNGRQNDTGLGGQVQGNYATWNSLISTTNLTNGNLSVVQPGTSAASRYSTFGMSSGKWYWEITVVKYANTVFGIRTPGGGTLETPYDSTGYGMGWRNSGGFFIGGSNTGSGSLSLAAGDVLGLGFDANAGTLAFYKNGSLVHTLTANASYIGQTWFAGSQDSVAGNSDHDVNFGQRPYVYQNAGTNRPSADYKALCTANLPEPAIKRGDDYFQTLLYTGNGSTQTLGSLRFSPDLVWIKSRSNSFFHRLYDTIRGTTKALYSNSTGTEGFYQSDYENFTAFNSDGFSLGSATIDDGINKNGSTFAAWCWDAGSSTVTNTQGSITSSCRTNQSSGFSVIGWTGASSGTASIGHGLGVAPAMVIARPRNATSNWVVYHRSVGNDAFLRLNTTDASVSSSACFGTGPTSTVFTLNQGSLFAIAGDCIGYAFAPVAGYSSAFSYTGNGSSDGPFCFLGFRPRFLIIKRTDAAYGWYMYDTARDTYNIAGKELLANASDAEVSDSDLDILSNGFKPRRSSLAFNASGGTFVGFAWAESPFQYARAR